MVKYIHIPVDDSIHERVKITAIKKGTTMRELILSALAAHVPDLNLTHEEVQLNHAQLEANRALDAHVARLDLTNNVPIDPRTGSVDLRAVREKYKN